jgi:hypothetical protein
LATELEIKAEIISFIKRHGGSASDYYVGIASDPKERLSQHRVDEDKDVYQSWQAPSSEVARRIEEVAIEVLHTKGGKGGGDENTKLVYIYKINEHTNEEV